MMTRFFELCPYIEKLSVCSNQDGDGFDLSMLKDYCEHLSSLKLNSIKLVTISSHKPVMHNIINLNLTFAISADNLHLGVLFSCFPNVINLTLIDVQQEVKPPRALTPEARFFLPHGLKTLHTNISLFTRINDVSLRNLEELYLSFDCYRSNHLLPRFERSVRIMPRLRVVNITANSNIQHYSVSKLWQLAMFISKHCRSVKVLSVRGLTSDAVGETCYEKVPSKKFKKISKYFRLFRFSRSSLVYFNFFENIMTAKDLDQQTIDRCVQLDEEFNWNLMRKN